MRRYLPMRSLAAKSQPLHLGGLINFAAESLASCLDSYTKHPREQTHSNPLLPLTASNLMTDECKSTW